MKFAPLRINDPRIKVAVEHHKKLWDLPASARPAATRWIGVWNETNELLVVVGEADQGEYVEVTDMYPLPPVTREAKRACYEVVSLYNAARLRGVKIMVRCLARNLSMQRAIKRVTGLDPKTVVYFT